MVAPVGVEPTRSFRARDFKSQSSSIPSRGRLIVFHGTRPGNRTLRQCFVGARSPPGEEPRIFCQNPLGGVLIPKDLHLFFTAVPVTPICLARSSTGIDQTNSRRLESSGQAPFFERLRLARFPAQALLQTFGPALFHFRLRTVNPHSSH